MLASLAVLFRACVVVQNARRSPCLLYLRQCSVIQCPEIVTCPIYLNLIRLLPFCSTFSSTIPAHSYLGHHLDHRGRNSLFLSCLPCPIRIASRLADPSLNSPVNAVQFLRLGSHVMTSPQQSIQPKQRLDAPAHTVKMAEQERVQEKKQIVSWLSPQLSSYFIAGGVAGAASRTVVSPLERLKIIQSVGTSHLPALLLMSSCKLVGKYNPFPPTSNTRVYGQVLSACGERRVSRDI